MLETNVLMLTLNVVDLLEFVNALIAFTTSPASVVRRLYTSLFTINGRKTGNRKNVKVLVTGPTVTQKKIVLFGGGLVW